MATLILNNTTSPVSRSGQLEFNTNKQTLVVGNGTAEISMATTGSNTFTGNQTITGSLSVTGNLTLGGNITIGDNVSDNIVFNADVSSSIIPNNDNAFDLGSASYRYKDIYGVNIYGAINATNGVVSGSSQVTPLLPTGVVSGSSQITYASISSIPAGIVSGSAQVTLLLPTGTVSGSSQITYASISSIPGGIVSGSSQVILNDADKTGFDTTDVAEGTNLYYTDARVKTKLDAEAIVSSSTQVTTLLPTGVVSGSIQVLGGTGIVSGSSQITYANISSIPAGIVSGSAQVTPLLPTGVVSGSSQLNNTSIENLTVVNLTTVNETASVIFSSGSNRFGDLGDDIHDFTGSVKISGSITTIGSSTATSFNGTINANNGVVSGSSQIIYANISSIPAGIVSGSSQILGGSGVGSGSYETTGRGIVSGSSQVTPLLPTGTISGSSQVTGIGNAQLTNSSTTIGTTAIALGASSTTLAGLTSVTSTGFTGALTGNASTATTLATARTINGTSFNGSADITIPNLVSGSSQISLTATTGYGTYINQAILTTSSPTFAGLTINGAITATGNISAYVSSDRRLKNNIVPIENALTKLNKIGGYSFDWTDDYIEKESNGKGEDGYFFRKHDIGVIAQELQEILPEAVAEKTDGYLGVRYEKIIPLLIQSIKELQLEIKELKNSK